MATDFWKRRLERLGERFSNCEAVELSMIREAKPVSDASHKAYLADLLSEAASKAEFDGRVPIKGQKPDVCPMFGWGDVKIGSIFFYAPSLLTMPRADAKRIWEGLDALFVEAGGTLEFIPSAIFQRLGECARSLSGRKLRWAASVFDLALRLNRVDMTYLMGQPRPGCWSATLENVMASSLELIDWLLAADDTPDGASTGGIDAEPKREAEAAGQGGKASELSKAKGRTTNRLRPCDKKAFSQYQHAIEQESSIVSDDEAYDWLVEDLRADGISLTRRDNWKRYVGRARTHYGKQKNGPRIGNETHSVVSATRLDTPKRTKADQR